MLNGPGEFVMMVLTSDTPLHYRFQGSNHRLVPGEKKILPWGHMDYLCGNPYLTEEDRSERLTQILRRYGARRLEDLPYTIEVTDAEGDRITTIIEDPDGIHALHQSVTEELDPQAIRAAMVSMQRRMAHMETMLSEADSAAAAEPTDADAPDAATIREQARARALASQSMGTVQHIGPSSGDDSDVISAVAPHLVPSTEIPTDAPIPTDSPSRVPTA